MEIGVIYSHELATNAEEIKLTVHYCGLGQNRLGEGQVVKH